MRWLVSAVLVLSATAGYCAGGAAGSRRNVVQVDPNTTTTLLGEVNTDSVSRVLMALAQMEAGKAKSVTLVIDSPGGYVDPGLRLVVALDSLRARGRTVRCIVTGEAMSMAYYLLGACTERLVMARSQLLWHPIRVGFRGGITGEAALAIGQSLLAFEQSMKEELITRMGVDPDWFDMHWRAETSHHGSDLAVAAPDFVRVIDGVAGLPTEQLFWIRQPDLLDLFGTTQPEDGVRTWGGVHASK